jgi:hypothetical protein
MLARSGAQVLATIHGGLVVAKGVKGSDRILLFLYYLSYFFIKFGTKRIMVGYEFKYGLYQTMDSD